MCVCVGRGRKRRGRERREGKEGGGEGGGEIGKKREEGGEGEREGRGKERRGSVRETYGDLVCAQPLKICCKCRNYKGMNIADLN